VCETGNCLGKYGLVDVGEAGQLKKVKKEIEKL
jgi:hypothetical protein